MRILPPYSDYNSLPLVDGWHCLGTSQVISSNLNYFEDFISNSGSGFEYESGSDSRSESTMRYRPRKATGRYYLRENPKTPAPLPLRVLRIQGINQLINSRDPETTSLNLAKNGSISLDLNSWM